MTAYQYSLGLRAEEPSDRRRFVVENMRNLSAVHGDGLAKLECLQRLAPTEDDIGEPSATGLVEHLRGDLPDTEQLGFRYRARELADADYARVPRGSAFIRHARPYPQHLLPELTRDALT